MTQAIQQRNSVRTVRKKSLTADIVVGRFLLLLATGFLAYGASSLVGNTMLEDARRSAIRCKERAKEMRQQVALLRQQSDRLSNMHAVEQWAGLRGYVRSGNFVDMTAEDLRVARR
ncbi:MAG: hypothetical protein HONBIEJF_00291 [Fimbriimonadaceae bacterium]|nr:hypothetical protein [Fimbriimonadaceae bacterium]